MLILSLAEDEVPLDGQEFLQPLKQHEEVRTVFKFGAVLGEGDGLHKGADFSQFLQKLRYVIVPVVLRRDLFQKIRDGSGSRRNGVYVADAFIHFPQDACLPFPHVQIPYIVGVLCAELVVVVFLSLFFGGEYMLSQRDEAASVIIRNMHVHNPLRQPVQDVLDEAAVLSLSASI